MSVHFRYIITCWGDYRQGFGLVIGFIDHLHTQLRTTSHYSAIADLTLQITRAHTESLFQPAVSSLVVFGNGF
jgi:hypothetical protein